MAAVQNDEGAESLAVMEKSIEVLMEFGEHRRAVEALVKMGREETAIHHAELHDVLIDEVNHGNNSVPDLTLSI